jgi:dTDP-6-deoxy-L-talose 4-dehydrogenase (NAD+)
VKIWVTGANGFIGRHVVAQATLAGHEVWAIVRHRADIGGDRAGNARVLGIHLDDAREVASCIAKTSPDVIIHLAWYARPQDYLASPDNVESLATTLSFAKAALFAGCRKMIGVGTCLEYANVAHPRGEDDLLDPKSLYARCKRAAHLVLAELFDRHGAALVWARLFHTHGPGEHPARLIPSVAAALREGRPFALSPGEQLRDHLDVRDVGSALVHLAGRQVAGPVNLCSGEPVTLRTVVEAVGREVGRFELLQFGQRPYRDDEVMNLTGVSTRLLQTGWRRFHTDLAQSIREAIAVGDGKS